MQAAGQAGPKILFDLSLNKVSRRRENLRNGLGRLKGATGVRRLGRPGATQAEA
jgi:hypothetical protein